MGLFSNVGRKLGKKNGNVVDIPTLHTAIWCSFITAAQEPVIKFAVSESETHSQIFAIARLLCVLGVGTGFQWWRRTVRMPHSMS